MATLNDLIGKVEAEVRQRVGSQSDSSLSDRTYPYFDARAVDKAIGDLRTVASGFDAEFHKPGSAFEALSVLATVYGNTCHALYEHWDRYAKTRSEADFREALGASELVNTLNAPRAIAALRFLNAELFGDTQLAGYLDQSLWYLKTTLENTARNASSLQS
ncbi:MAG: hypothetical protein ACMXYM_01125 [Candidatus Woesearchaeota archaeon]